MGFVSHKESEKTVSEARLITFFINCFHERQSEYISEVFINTGRTHTEHTIHTPSCYVTQLFVPSPNRLS